MILILVSVQGGCGKWCTSDLEVQLQLGCPVGLARRQLWCRGLPKEVDIDFQSLWLPVAAEETAMATSWLYGALLLGCMYRHDDPLQTLLLQSGSFASTAFENCPHHQHRALCANLSQTLWSERQAHHRYTPPFWLGLSSLAICWFQADQPTTQKASGVPAK